MRFINTEKKESFPLPNEALNLIKFYGLRLHKVKEENFLQFCDQDSGKTKNACIKPFVNPILFS